ncbi:CMGC/DYRK protein kinase [Salpingoeca rosetta]|uniref:CMGC/DYRK protein kinase n=1 Tax=Salpingoeca rosetta (strain ATCC 50818 / BSB-021) TaxID=946362 RepID=F2UJK6_SALR5|nr:CMGC/DYRK protein kinase [Salpingoeca rosetta]EGD77305.1 CMGC/DYRK protein kinase [Salpingoeca rosetta]|eukprot:XP_004990649.1 CMGC/DYRK protein kinase [Salpingoeca rosetta]
MGRRPVAKTRSQRVRDLRERQDFQQQLEDAMQRATSRTAKTFLAGMLKSTCAEIKAIKRANIVGTRMNQKATIKPREGSRFRQFDAASAPAQSNTSTSSSGAPVAHKPRPETNLLLKLTKNICQQYSIKPNIKPHFITPASSGNVEDARAELEDPEPKLNAMCDRLRTENNVDITPDQLRRLHNREGNLRIHTQDVILDDRSRKFTVLRLLGCGAYGQVLRVKDADGIEHALKLLNSKRQSNREVEAKVLKLVEHHGRTGSQFVLKLESSFLFRGAFPCMLFAQHGISLYDHILRKGSLNMDQIVVVIKQVALALREVHTLGFVHSDVKPENILLRHTPAELEVLGNSADTPDPDDPLSIPPRLSVVLIDFGTAFGSSINADGWSVKYIQSRFYRAPEVFLECRRARRQYIYDTPIDMWSLGCLAMELYLGQPLFQGRSSIEMVTGFTSLLGDFPSRMLELASSVEVIVEDEQGRKRVRSATRSETVYIPTRRFHVRCLDDFVCGTSVCSSCQPDIACTVERRRLFMKFVSDLLKLDPDRRLTAGQAVRHPFLKPSIPQSVIDEIPEGHVNESFRTFRITTFQRPRLPQEAPLIVETDNSTITMPFPNAKRAERPIRIDFVKNLAEQLKLQQRKARRLAFQEAQQQAQVRAREERRQRSSRGEESARSSAVSAAGDESSAESSRGSSVYYVDSSRPESSMSIRSNQSEQVLIKGVVSQSHIQHAEGHQHGSGGGTNNGAIQPPGSSAASGTQGAASQQQRVKVAAPQARPHTQMHPIPYVAVSQHQQQQRYMRHVPAAPGQRFMHHVPYGGQGGAYQMPLPHPQHHQQVVQYSGHVYGGGGYSHGAYMGSASSSAQQPTPHQQQQQQQHPGHHPQQSPVVYAGGMYTQQGHPVMAVRSGYASGASQASQGSVVMGPPHQVMQVATPQGHMHAQPQPQPQPVAYAQGHTQYVQYAQQQQHHHHPGYHQQAGVPVQYVAVPSQQAYAMYQQQQQQQQQQTQLIYGDAQRTPNIHQNARVFDEQL